MELVVEAALEAVAAEEAAAVAERPHPARAETVASPERRVQRVLSPMAKMALMEPMGQTVRMAPRVEKAARVEREHAMEPEAVVELEELLPSRRRQRFLFRRLS